MARKGAAPALVALTLDLSDEDRALLGELADADDRYRTLEAMVQFLACSAAAYTFAVRGEPAKASRMVDAARRGRRRSV